MQTHARCWLGDVFLAACVGLASATANEVTRTMLQGEKLFSRARESCTRTAPEL